MADGIETYSEARQVAKYKAGIKGSDFFGEPNPPPAISIVEGWPAEVSEKLNAQPVTKMTPSDPWVYRYPNTKL